MRDESETSPDGDVDIGQILGAEELRLLGEATAYAAMIEAVAAGIHGALNCPPDAALETATTSGKRIGWLLAELESAARPEVAAWAENTRAAIERRHALVHTAWLFRLRNDYGEFVFGTRSHATDYATVLQPESFTEIRDLCKAMYNSGRRLSRGLHGI